MLRGANLIDADLLGTYINDADFTECMFGFTFISLASLSQAIGLKSAIHLNPSSIGVDTLTQTLRGSGGKFTMEQLIFFESAGVPHALLEYLPSIMESSPLQFYSCFISYSHDDKPFAQKLYNALREKSIPCWLDEKQLLPGDDIYDQVDRGIRLWDKVLLCCSEASLTSWWVDNEIDTAFEKERRLMKERNQKVLVLIPLDVDGYMFTDEWRSGKKQQVLSRLAADFTDWDTDQSKFNAQFDRVIKALLAADGGREKPPISLL